MSWLTLACWHSHFGCVQRKLQSGSSNWGRWSLLGILLGSLGSPHPPHLHHHHRNHSHWMHSYSVLRVVITQLKMLVILLYLHHNFITHVLNNASYKHLFKSNASFVELCVLCARKCSVHREMDNLLAVSILSVHQNRCFLWLQDSGIKV